MREHKVGYCMELSMSVNMVPFEQSAKNMKQNDTI